ncbi:MAG: sigma 54-interacting transcriptional regulator [bacterium]|nr:sigma 54-interacting transcriptional regulator [bacterium]
MAARSSAFVSDREREILEAVTRMATSNPFAPDRIDQERLALGDGFTAYTAVWHMDGDVEGLNPNVLRLKELAEGMAEDLRSRLVEGARPSREELALYEGFVRYLLFYRYSPDLTRIIHDREKGRPATRKLGFYGRYASDFSHFFEIPGVEFPEETNAPHVLAWGFQIRRAFHHVFTQIYGGSMPIAELRGKVWRAVFTHDVERYRRSLYGRMGDIPALVLGESGTGKELVARAIGLSRYIPLDPERACFVADFADGYQAVNLAALSSSLIESEVFGHRKGAFTGAVEDRAGWLEGSGPFGTIFLDEIGDLDPGIQVKLLRVLQSRTFQRIGETIERRFEGKIVAATNADLEQGIEDGTFREDLYYRLCANVIEMPTLRAQIEADDGAFEQLTQVIAVRIAGSEEEGDGLAKEVLGFVRSGLPADYAWPGNVRELEQCVRSVLVQGSYAPPRRRDAGERLAASGVAPMLLAGEASAEALLRDYTTRVYAKQGSYEAAARVLGLDRRTVKAKLDPELLEELRAEG